MRLKFVMLTLIGVGGVAGAPARGAEPESGAQFFENRIRPILSEHCYKCHSAGAAKIKGGLTLDTKQAVLRGGKDGPVMVPGDPDKSALIKAVRYADPDLQMPPDEKLSARQIADLTQWIRMGAPDPRDAKDAAVAGKLTGLTDKARAHWAYQPVKNPPAPEVKEKQWVRTPIDAFVLSRFEAAGMQPNAPADKETLLRRATFDLIGMPPTTDELRAFLSDRSPDAFAKVVDRLLASPHYGERWGRHWLDTARYADTGGPQVRLDNPDYRYAFAWVYRDYVIDSFNTDKPYDQFIMEQIAADKLPPSPDNSALAGLGFLTVGERFDNPENLINERIDAVGKGFLGLTVTCARCHDHKFDPIPTEDYYSLRGIFASVVEPREKPIVGKPNASTADYLAKVSALSTVNRELYYGAVTQWAAGFRPKAATYMLYLARYGRIKSGNYTAQDVRIRKEAIEKGGLDEKLFQGSWWWHDVPEDPVWGPLVRFIALKPEEFPAKSKALAAAVAANAARTSGADKGRLPYNPRVAALFEGAAPNSLQDVENRYNALFAGLEPQARAYIAAKKDEDARAISSFDPALVQLINIPFSIAFSNQLTFEKLRQATDGWPERLLRELKFTYGEKNELDLTHPGVPHRAMVLEDAPEPKDSPVFLRGDPNEKGPIVPRRFLQVLSGSNRPVFKQGSGRLELARAIASRDNPLTARVAVNRIWMHHFGEGIVPTPDDLGVQSEKPSHPELIDWLASYFMDNDWSFKKLHRIIMLSSAYQQSSRSNPRYAQMDPGNRLLWRANVRRLEFEALRDSLLVYSGKLDPTFGGQPVNVTDEPYTFRRSVYGYIDRGMLSDLLPQFDFSDPRMPNSKRATTIVPQQALFLMNSPMVVDVSRKIVARAEFASARDDADRVAALYRIVYQREPRAEEVEMGLTYVRQLEAILSSQAAHPFPISKPPERRKRRHDYTDLRAPLENPGAFVDRRPLTTWEQYAQALLFSNEVAFVK